MSLLDKKAVSLGALATAVLAAVILLASPAGAQKRKRNKSDNISLTETNKEQKIEIDNRFLEAEKYFLLKDYTKSMEYFKQVLELDPANAAANYKMAQILSDTKENIEALPYAIKAKQQALQNKYYYTLLASIYTHLADLEMAAATYADLVSHVDNTANYLFELASLQLYMKKYDEALATYDKASEHFGVVEQIVFQKQKIYLKQNKLDFAIEEGEKLIANNPGNSNYAVSLAQILISNNRLDGARELLEEFVEENGEDAIIGVQLAEIYRKSGDIKAALFVLEAAFRSPAMALSAKLSTLSGYIAMLPSEELEEPILNLTEALISTHPDSYQSYAAAGDVYLKVGRKQEAKSSYKQAIELNASNFNVWQDLIMIGLELKEYQEVITYSEKALELFPNQASIYYFGSVACMIEREYQKAIQLLNAGKVYTAFDKALSSEMNGQLGDAYNSLGEHKKSDAAYDEALKLNPENDHVLNNYSYFLSLRKENLAKAEEMSTKLITLKGGNPTYLDTHGWVLYSREKYKEAHDFLKQAAAKADNATIIEHYGDVLFQLGNVEEALIQWKKARDLIDDKDHLNKKISDRKLYE